MKPIFTMMVGLPGSGKSTKAKELGGIICSSDEIRKELFGDENHVCTNQENAKVFEEMFKRTKANLLAGNNVVYDATNLSKKRRIGLLKQLNGVDCCKHCILMATDYEMCLQRNKDRDRSVPETVIQEMYQNFAPPHKSEGWDYIRICVTYYDDNYCFSKLLETCSNFDQKNKHHSLSLLGHLVFTKEYVGSKNKDSELILAASLHDIGKLKTQVIDDKGEAHYHNHQCAGAYDALFYIYKQVVQTSPNIMEHAEVWVPALLNVSNLIYYHMHPYLSWAQSEKAKERDRALLGEEMFNQILLLHEGDVAAH